MNKDDEFGFMIKQEQIRQLSEEDDQQIQNREETHSKNQFRKPIKNPFSDDNYSSDSDIQPEKKNVSVFPPKPPKNKSVLEKVQQQMKWNKDEQNEIQFLCKLQGQGIKEKKIRQLASKVKSTNLILERQKTMRKTLQCEINQIIKVNKQEKISSQQDQGEKKEISECKTRQNKCSNCSQTNKKIMQLRLKNQNMKTELNKVQRIIAREIGEQFNVDQVLSEENGWKGRQQKIEKLRARVKQLEQKLYNNGINLSHMSGFTQISNQNNPNFIATQKSSNNLAENKRKEIQNLKIQVQALKKQNQLLQGKIKSLCSRKIILENQLKQNKYEYEKKKNLFIEKNENDNKFIELLQNENQKLKKNEKIITKIIYKDNIIDRQNQQNQKKKEIKKINQNIKIKKNQKLIIKKQINEINNIKQISIEKKQNIQQEYLKNYKYLKKMTSQDQEEIYQLWKNSKK